MDLAKHIDATRSHALTTLKELLKIKSEAEDPVTTASGEVYPFGRGVQDAFAYMLSKGEELGFSVRNVDNYGGHIDFGEGEETVGISMWFRQDPDGITSHTEQRKQTDI